MSNSSTRRVDANLSDEAIAVAVAWSTLPDRPRETIKMQIDILFAQTSGSASLKELFTNAHPVDQRRSERIEERMRAILEKRRKRC